MCPSQISLLREVVPNQFAARGRSGLVVKPSLRTRITSHAGGHKIGPRHRLFFFSGAVVFFLIIHLLELGLTLLYLIAILSGVGMPVPGCAL